MCRMFSSSHCWKVKSPMSSTTYLPAWLGRSQPVLPLVTRTMSVIDVPLVVVPSLPAQ